MKKDSSGERLGIIKKRRCPRHRVREFLRGGTYMEDVPVNYTVPRLLHQPHTLPVDMLTIDRVCERSVCDCVCVCVGARV